MDTSRILSFTCSGCEKQYAADQLQTYCADCHAPLLAQYDLGVLRAHLNCAELSARPRGLWRWRELLPEPTAAHAVTLEEGDTPFLPLTQLGKQLGLPQLFLKDEGHNPTASHEARGMALAVSRLKALGIDKVVLAGPENQARALAAYAAQAGLAAHLYLPAGTQPKALDEMRCTGASVDLIEGLINGRDNLPLGTIPADWFDFSAFYEPYLIEGRKTIGFEIAEALGWELPDVILCPVGHGASVVGLWKAFAELEALGWLKHNRRPRLVAVQARGCAPFVKAFEAEASFCDYWTNARSIATHLVVPKSFADQLVLKILSETRGTALAITDEAMRAAQQQLKREEGILASFEGAATLAALFKLVQQKWIKPNERVVLLNPARERNELEQLV